MILFYQIPYDFFIVIKSGLKTIYSSEFLVYIYCFFPFIPGTKRKIYKIYTLLTLLNNIELNKREISIIFQLTLF